MNARQLMLPGVFSCILCRIYIRKCRFTRIPIVCYAQNAVLCKSHMCESLINVLK
jgi:hypothetical protein